MPLPFNILWMISHALKIDLRILGLVHAMGGADCGSENVHACAFDEFHRLLGIRQLRFIFRDLDLVFHAAHSSQLAFDRDVADLVTVIHHFLGLADILFVGLLGSVDHDVGVAGIRALLAVVNIWCSDRGAGRQAQAQTQPVCDRSLTIISCREIATA